MDTHEAHMRACVLSHTQNEEKLLDLIMIHRIGLDCMSVCCALNELAQMLKPWLWNCSDGSAKTGQLETNMVF